jgi:hypothetical protein
VSVVDRAFGHRKVRLAADGGDEVRLHFRAAEAKPTLRFGCVWVALLTTAAASAAVDKLLDADLWHACRRNKPQPHAARVKTSGRKAAAFAQSLTASKCHQKSHDHPRVVVLRRRV